MSKKIVLVAASPRVGGNSEVALEILAQELPQADVTMFKLREKKCNPCMACNACQSKGNIRCVQQDDMAALLPQLEAADAIVLAAPIYFGTVNGPAKNFIDRLYPFFNPMKEGMTNSAKLDKKAAILCTFGGGAADAYRAQADYLANGFHVAGAKEIKTEVFGGLLQPGAIKDNPAHLAKLKAIAEWLGQ